MAWSYESSFFHAGRQGGALRCDGGAVRAALGDLSARVRSGEPFRYGTSKERVGWEPEPRPEVRLLAAAALVWAGEVLADDAVADAGAQLLDACASELDGATRPPLAWHVVAAFGLAARAFPRVVASRAAIRAALWGRLCEDPRRPISHAFGLLAALRPGFLGSFR